MALAIPVAAAINPASNQEVMVWYLQDGYARFEIQDTQEIQTLATSSVERAQKVNDSDENEEPPPGAVAATDESPKQVAPFMDTSSFAQARTKNTVYIFGVRDDYEVCMISPAYQPLSKNPKATSYSIAACADETKGFESLTVYFLRQTGESDPKLIQYTPATGKSVTLTYAHPKKNSRLSALFVPHNGSKVPTCFFQEASTIHECNTVSKGVSPLPHIKDIAPLTPMATCVLNRVTYFFWLSAKYDLLVATHKEGGTWGQQFSIPPNKDGVTPETADPESSIAAVADQSATCIYLYYRQEGSDQDYDLFVWKNPF